MTTVFARETLTEHLIAEMLPLLSAHWREVAQFQDIPLDVDIATYLNAEASGLARCYTVRTAQETKLYDVPLGINEVSNSMWRVAGALVGYAVFFVRPNPHYRASVQAVQDVLYLDPSMRGGKGGEFIGWCDEQLKAEGVQVAYQHAKLAHPQLGIVLSRLGYEPVETIYAKRLDAGVPAAEFSGIKAGGEAHPLYLATFAEDGSLRSMSICDEDGG